MILVHHRSALAAVALLAAFALPGTAAAQTIDCQMRFTLSGWSAFFKTSSGNGTVTCSNGQRMDVRLSAKGGGLTVGRHTIEDGRGEFTGVYDISEVLGSYATAEAHAGAVRSASGRVMTKGEVAMALSGTGRGFDLGVAFGKFTIRRAR